MSKKSEMAELAQSLGMQFDEQALMIHGRHQVHHMCMTLIESTYRMQIAVSVAKDGRTITEEEAKSFVKGVKSLISADVSGRRVVFETAGAPGMKKCFEKVQAAASEIATYLTSNGYTDCCEQCGAETDLAAYTINDGGYNLCSNCFSGVAGSMAGNKEALKRKKGNLVTGLVGALLGSLLGVACIVIIGQLGYVAAISGIVMGVCALKGYELLGGKLSTLGVVLSCVIMLAMVYVGDSLDWAIALAPQLTEAFGETFTVLDTFRLLPDLLAEEIIDAGTYFGNLAMLYIFTVLGAFPTVRSAMSHKDGNYEARRATSGMTV